MATKCRFIILLVAVLLYVVSSVAAQSTTGTISGAVTDEKEAAIPNATVTVRNTETNVARTAQTDADGRYRFENVPVGAYEMTVESGGFAKYVRSGITLALNQPAVVEVTMRAGGVQEIVTVTENASLLNTTTAEVGTRFDAKRISELPLTANRNVYNVALSAAGISQLGAGQSSFAGGGQGSTSGVSYSANGGRIRSNNFMIDGQDNNEVGVTGAQQFLNNPDLIQEVQLITNQLTAEYGRNASSVFNAITKSGTNEFHGSAFWFHNDNALNACSNIDKAAGFCNPNATVESRTKAPFRIENQIGGSFGGPVILPRFGEGGPAVYDGRDKTFFFVSIQRWWDRVLGSGSTIRGVPTEAGRQILQSAVGGRPQIGALLRFLPAAQSPINQNATFTANGQTYVVPLGSLTGSVSGAFNDWQASGRIDHRLNENHTLTGRYIFGDNDSDGIGDVQTTPPGNATKVVQRAQSVNTSLASVLSSSTVNELRLAYQRFANVTSAQDPSSEAIPAIEIFELGLQEFNASSRRTGIGLGANLPQFATRNSYQIQDNFSYTRGSHAMKFGADIQRKQLAQFFFPISRGRLAYNTLQTYVDDIAAVATINRPLAGGVSVFHYDWHDLGFYWQDAWRIRPNFTLNYGLRYETPGQPITDLVSVNERIVDAAGGNQGYVFTPVPKRDKNNFQPRLGFNWNPRTEGGVFNFLTGGDKLVLRGGYSRTNDYSFTNMASNIQSAFPFVAAVALVATPQPGGAAGVSDAFVRLPQVQGATGLNPNQLQRTVVSDDFRSPYYDNFSLEVQRELTPDLVLRVGYVGTKGNSLFQTIDGNPIRPDAIINGPDLNCVATPANTCRVNPALTFFRLRANTAQSIYHSMQVSMDKRLSRGFSAGLHYTWSAFIDNATEIFNSSNGEIAVSQNSFDRTSERARSSYDRPHRLSGNFVYELPYFREQRGFLGHVLGGWQLNSFFTFQSGSPFTPLNGSDPQGALVGIDNFVGSAIRPNVRSTLDLSRLSVEELVAAGGSSLFQTLQRGQRFGNAGRNILRADGIGNVDFGLLKNTRLGETQNLQLRADFFNLTNTRNFGVPIATITSSAFLNQWGTNGGNRRIIVGLRYVF